MQARQDRGKPGKAVIRIAVIIPGIAARTDRRGS
jgi:hypothetical protein